MNVLVTGVDGFVGNHLANALTTLPDIHLFGTVRSVPESSSPSSSSVPQFAMELADLDQVCDVLHRVSPEKIFHLAGQAFVPLSKKNPYETFQSNVQGTLNLLEAVRTYEEESGKRCSVLIISSGEVYGPVLAEHMPIDEHVPVNPQNPYAASKASAELIAEQYRTTFGLDIVITRPFNHLGPGQSDLFVGSAFAKQVAEIKLGKRKPTLFVGNLNPMRDFTDVRDVVRAYIMLLHQSRKFSVYNICSGKAVAVREILNGLCESVNIDVDIVSDPERMRENDIPKIFGSALRLQTETGWEPHIPLRQTLNDLLSYWENKLRYSS